MSIGCPLSRCAPTLPAYSSPGLILYTRNQARYLLIYKSARIDATKRRIRKSPLARIETVALIDERGCVFPCIGFFPEHGLPAVRVAQPFVRHQHTGKCRKVFNFGQHAL